MAGVGSKEKPSYIKIIDETTETRGRGNKEVSQIEGFLNLV